MFSLLSTAKRLIRDDCGGHVDQPAVRVLSVIDSLGQGGAERSLIDMARDLGRHDVFLTIAVLRLTDHGFHRDFERASTIPVEELGSRRFRAIRRLRRLIRAGEYGVVHSTLFESSLVARLGAARTGVPVLTSLVNVSYDTVRHQDPRVSKSKLAAARFIDAVTARHLNSRFHALTETVAASAVSDLGIRRESIDVIPRGRDSSEFRPPASDEERLEIRAQLGVDREAKVVLTVGRHEFQKGQRFLIQAMQSVSEHVPETVLLVLGRAGAETESLLHQVAELGLQSKVWFLGDRRDVNAVLRAVDLFVFPSVYEGFGGSVIEAMATGLPIVVSDLPALREVLGETGTYTPAGDARALSDAIASILTDGPESGSSGEAVLERFLARYQLDNVVARMATLFKETASAARGETRTT